MHDTVAIAREQCRKLAVHLLAEDQLNTYDVLVSDYVVFTEAALRAFVERGSK